MKSASRPVSNEQLKELKKQAETPEGKLDKKGNLKKFSRDLDSDWKVKNDKPHFGLKEHSFVDTENGFILATYLSPSSQNDSIHLPIVVISSVHTTDKTQTVYANKGQKARFAKIMKNNIDIMFRQFAFNLKKGAKILEPITV